MAIVDLISGGVPLTGSHGRVPRPAGEGGAGYRLSRGLAGLGQLEAPGASFQEEGPAEGRSRTTSRLPPT